MSNPTRPTNDEALLGEVLQRSATDRAFRTRLIEQPGTAIEEVIGSATANTPRVKFIEKTEGLDALIVLPDFLDPEGNLSDAELEAVAGGDWCITSCGWSICLMTNDNTVTVCKAEG